MTFLYILAGILILFWILTLISPKNYHVSRSIEINKPLPEVFNFIKYVKNQDHWSPWDQKDPDMKKEYRGEDGEAGFVSAWKGNKEVGEGEQEITGIYVNDRMESQLRFFKPWKSESDAYIKVEEVSPEITKVTWGFSGVNKPPANIFMLFFNMDKMIGKDFESGLIVLKKHLEE
jgi:hypothetical protein